MNLDASTAITLVAEGSIERRNVRALIQGRAMVMTRTALDEFNFLISARGGPLETARAARFLGRVTVIADQPSNRAKRLIPTGALEPEDIVILGTGDQLGIPTVTADRRAVSTAIAQGVHFRVHVHHSVTLTGR